jgi:anti-anti-sigma regulatory factor
MIELTVIKLKGELDIKNAIPEKLYILYISKDLQPHVVVNVKRKEHDNPLQTT